MTELLATRLLADAFGRVPELVRAAVDGLTSAQLAWRPTPEANSIAWLVWHLARVEDDHVAGVAEADQVWFAQGWGERFALPVDARDIGYGQSAEQARSVVVDSGELLTGYYDSVHARTLQVLAGMSDADFDRIVDRRWTPPVTAAVRLVSVVNDITQHVGQAAYVRGILPPSLPPALPLSR
jgi:hypothetical protein